MRDRQDEPAAPARPAEDGPPPPPREQVETPSAPAACDGAGLDSSDAAAGAATGSVPDARTRLIELLRPRASTAQIAVGVLCLLLGFAVAAQVRSIDGDGKFATAREEELVGVLDSLSQRSTRLRSDIRELERTKAELERDGAGDSAVAEARRRATTYGLLAGTIPATGPGVELVITDPDRKIRATVLLDTLQELRDAGAEVVQINDVRVGVDTYFVDAAGGGVTVDGTWLRSPYRFLVIGQPQTLAAALDIPGGVMETLRNAGATGRVTQREIVEINAVRSPGTAPPAAAE